MEHLEELLDELADELLDQLSSLLPNRPLIEGGIVSLIINLSLCISLRTLDLSGRRGGVRGGVMRVLLGVRI